MRLDRVYCQDYRCFARAELSLSPRVTLLAGPNNAGKSSLIRAVQHLQAPVIGDAKRIGADEGSLLYQLTRSAGENVPPLPALAEGEQSFEVKIDLPGAENVFRGAAVFGRLHRFPNEQPRNFLIPYLSARRAAGYNLGVNPNAANELSGNHSNIISKIDRVFGSAQLRPAYERACSAVLGFVPTTHQVPNGKMVGLEVDAAEQIHIPLDLLGAGVPNAAGLIVDLITARSKLFLIEELENDLYPTALRALLRLVIECANRGNQFLLSTHSNIVMRELGAEASTRIYEVVPQPGNMPPLSELREVPRDAGARVALLRTLGYDLSDFELYSAYLVLEESSAERVIREFLVPWFVPGLQGRLRTLAAQGAGDLEPRVSDLIRTVVYLHLEPAYRGSTWAVADGDAAGLRATATLKEKFADWPADRFHNWTHGAFEQFYPEAFQARAAEALALEGRAERREAKRLLLEDVVSWARANEGAARIQFEQSCAEPIELLRRIAAAGIA